LVPVASQTVAKLDAQEEALGTQRTHPSPSRQSEGQVVTLEKLPLPSQILATFPSQTVWP
jgi:hypothetical protein